MASSETIIITGKLSRDVELRYSQDGKPFASFTIPIDVYGGKTSWRKVVVFGASAESCAKNLRKGSIVTVTGSLNVDKESGEARIWTDKDGNTRAPIEVTASFVKYIDNFGEEKSEQSAPKAAPATKVSINYDEQDEIPF